MLRGLSPQKGQNTLEHTFNIRDIIHTAVAHRSQSHEATYAKDSIDRITEQCTNFAIAFNWAIEKDSNILIDFIVNAIEQEEKRSGENHSV